MSKRIRITKRQLDEIVGGDYAYLDRLDKNDRVHKPNEVSVNGVTDSEGDGEPITTDQFASGLPKDSNWNGIGKNRPVPLTCQAKKWGDIIKEENSQLKGKRYGIPNKLKKVFQTNFKGYNGNKRDVGYERLKYLASHDDVSYSELKRIKNFFDTTTDSKAQELLGGNDAKMWAQNALSTSRGAVSNSKAFKSAQGESNVYQKAGGTKKSGNGMAHTTKNTTFTGDVTPIKPNIITF